MKKTLTPLLLALLALIPTTLFAQDIPESSPEAIEAHARGLRLYLGQEYRAAMPHFLRANELDPTFLVPLLMGAINAGNGGFAAERDSLWEMVYERQDQFSDYYNRLIDAYRAGATEERLQLAESLMDDYPGTKVAYNFALWSMSYNRAADAVRALKTLDPDKEPMKGWHSYYVVLENAYHVLGDFEAELATAREGYQRFPHRRAACGHLAQALAANGRVQELDRTLSECEETTMVVSGWTMGAIFNAVGRELLNHGHAGQAQPYLDRAMAWFEALPAEEHSRISIRGQHAYALYAAGRFEEGQEAYASLVEDFPRSIAYRTRMAACAALAGDEATAQEALAAIQAGEYSSNPAVQHGWSSFITAALGDEESTFDHFEGTWAGARWIHDDPAFLHGIERDEAFWAFMRKAR
jgi:tetratricopeptide (TPR) repeat protein